MFHVVEQRLVVDEELAEEAEVLAVPFHGGAVHLEDGDVNRLVVVKVGHHLPRPIDLIARWILDGALVLNNNKGWNDSLQMKTQQKLTMCRMSMGLLFMYFKQNSQIDSFCRRAYSCG